MTHRVTGDSRRRRRRRPPRVQPPRPHPPVPFASTLAYRSRNVVPPQYGHGRDQHADRISPRAAPSPSATACAMKPRHLSHNAVPPRARAQRIEVVPHMPRCAAAPPLPARGTSSGRTSREPARTTSPSSARQHGLRHASPSPSPFPACCHPNAQHPLPARRGTTLAEQQPRERLGSGNRTAPPTSTSARADRLLSAAASPLLPINLTLTCTCGVGFTATVSTSSACASDGGMPADSDRPEWRVGLHACPLRQRVGLRCLRRLAAWRWWMRPDAASKAPQYAPSFVSRWGHDRTPAYPHDQVASGAGLPPRIRLHIRLRLRLRRGPHCDDTAVFLVRSFLPTSSPFCCTFSSRTVSSLRRAYCAAAWLLRARLFAASVYALRLGLRRPAALHPPAPARAAHVHLRVCILGAGRPRDPTFLPALPPHVPPLIPRCGVLPRRRESCIFARR
ncbi:hypothetical protein B0H13DRAFT_839541 [Mycena leptocephala]|nr:hypothetical protein B0H13DRAFT_839541 [Mycena leptocephala]